MNVQFWAQFHGFAYQKLRIGVCGSREIGVYVMRISLVSREVLLVPLHTLYY